MGFSAHAGASTPDDGITLVKRRRDETMAKRR
jgi:hypothetical protein